MVTWPHNAPFALFLSHDVDTIYERNFWTLAGSLKRLELANFFHKIVSRRSPLAGVKAILEIEKKYAFTSTFFLLEDKTFSHFGGRYTYDDPTIIKLAELLKNDGNEIGVHGAYFAYNSAAKYKAQKAILEQNLQIEALGIRNHYLRHNGPETWQAQAEAGFRYDSTKENGLLPFSPLKDYPDFLLLPLTLMDVTIMAKTPQMTRAARLKYAQDICEPIMAAGGLITLNFHNNYFADPIYAAYQDLYEDLLLWLAEKKPWNATGREIANWYLKEKEAKIS